MRWPRQPWSSHRRVLTGVHVLAVALALVGLGRPAAADWASDEAYIKRLDEHLKELQRTATIFERQRRTLELVKFEFASLELPLADPSSSPEQIVRQLLQRSFPQVQVTMRELPTTAPPDVEIWKWRCRLVGAVEEIRWATQLLLRKGLFVVPGPGEPVRLVLEADQSRGTLEFIGHHIRLKEKPAPGLPQMPTGPDQLLTARSDPLAQEIRRLRDQVTRLRQRVQDIMTFEARVEAMRVVIKRLKTLTEGGRDPFRVFTPLLDLDLVRYQTLLHSGAEVAIQAAVPSASAGRAAQRWLARRRRRTLRYQFSKLDPLYQEALPRQIALAEADDTRAQPLCALRLAGARAIDLGVASGARAVVASGPDGNGVSGELAPASLRRGLEAAAREGGLELVWDREALLLVRRESAGEARRALAESQPGAGGEIKLRLPPGTAAQAIMARLQPHSRIPIRVAAEVLSSSAPVALAGRAPVVGWLRLVAAGLGLSLVRGNGWELRPAGKPAAAMVELKDGGPARSASPELVGLGQLRPRLLMACGRSPRAIVAADGGSPLLVRPGTRLGRSRSRVIRLDRSGITVRWSDAGVTASVLLPFGEPEAGPPGAPRKR